MATKRKTLNVNQQQNHFDIFSFLGNIVIFGGNKKELFSFINQIDEILHKVMKYGRLAQTIIIDTMKSKIQRTASEAPSTHTQAHGNRSHPILLNSFGGKSSVQDLFEELKGISFKTNCFQLYNEIKETLRTLNNKTTITPGKKFATKEQPFTFSKTN